MSTQVRSTQKPLSILRRLDVQHKTGLSRSTIYLRIAKNQFPAPIKLGGARAVGWIESEIEDWLEMQISSSRPSGA